MRVLFLTHYTGLYGANRSLLMLVRGLRKRGVDCAVLTPRKGRFNEVLARESITTGVVSFRPWMGERRWPSPYRALMNVASIPRLLGWILEWEPTVLYSNSSVIPAGAIAAKISGLGHVWHIREFGRSDYGLKYDFGYRWFRWWVRQADSVVAVSDAVKESVVDPIGVSCQVVYNAVVTSERIETLGRECLYDDVGEPFTFGIVGVLRPEKGQEQAIKALARLRDLGHDCCLVVVGGGSKDYEGQLRALVAKRRLEDRVRFTGFVDDPFEVYRQIDALLMCSECEAMGRVTAEAMAVARPVIGRRSGGTPEIVEEGRTGFLYDGTTEALANQMRRLVADHGLTRRMGQEGWRVARDKYVEHKYVTVIKEVIEKVT